MASCAWTIANLSLLLTRPLAPLLPPRDIFAVACREIIFDLSSASAAALFPPLLAGEDQKPLEIEKQVSRPLFPGRLWFPLFVSLHFPVDLFSSSCSCSCLVRVSVDCSRSPLAPSRPALLLLAGPPGPVRSLAGWFVRSIVSLSRSPLDPSLLDTIGLCPCPSQFLFTLPAHPAARALLHPPCRSQCSAGVVYLYFYLSRPAPCAVLASRTPSLAATAQWSQHANCYFLCPPIAPPSLPWPRLL